MFPLKITSKGPSNSRGDSSKRSVVFGGKPAGSTVYRMSPTGYSRKHGAPQGKTSPVGSTLPELTAPVVRSNPRGDSYLARRGITLPVVHQRNLITSGGDVTGECYLLDGTRTDLLEVAANSLKDQNLIEFNRFKEFKKFKGKSDEFTLVQASRLGNVFRPDRSAIHLNRILMAVIPAVNQGTPGRVAIRLCDKRMEAPYDVLFSCTNPVTNGYIYCINLGYSVPAAELDFKLRIEFLDVPIKDGKSPIWVKTAFHLSDKADPVFLNGTMSLGANMEADSHTEMLGSAALLLHEVNSHKKEYIGLGDEIDEEKASNSNSSDSFPDLTPDDSASQVGRDKMTECGYTLDPPVQRV